MGEELTQPEAVPDEEQVPTISTGSHDIDKKLGGGIPVGSLTLIEGQSASGKSVLVQQFAWGSLWASHKVVLYTTERTVAGHMRQMDSLGLDVLDFLLLGRLKVFPIHKVSDAEATYVLKELSAHMASDIKGSDAPDLVLVDSLTPIVMSAAVVDVIKFFELCRSLCSDGMTIVVTLHSYSLDGSDKDRIRSMCDANLNLRVDNVRDKLVNVMEVAKVSGATLTTGNVLSFAVEPKYGLRIIPLSFTKA